MKDEQLPAKEGHQGEIHSSASSEGYPFLPLLRVDGVSVVAPFGVHSLLTDISFNVEPGDRVAIVGASGAGKTTLLRVLNRLLTPSKGSVYLENQDYRQIDPIALRRQITLVLQEPKLLGMSVKDALVYPLKIRGVKPTDHSPLMQEVMESLHIPQEWLARNELELSAGQRQLVAIGRALIIQPKILLLDEPTSALDTGKVGQVLQILTKLTQKNITVVMVTHQLELAQDFSTRVLHLQQGCLMQNSPADIIDWGDLRQSLIQEESQLAQEWN
jgi:D-methionine transport system ATP-binding protein